MKRGLRKRIVEPASERPVGGTPAWLDLERLAEVEVSSEDSDHPIEHALLHQHEAGWQAARPGRQTIRILFDEPQTLRRVYLHFVETGAVRTQEFVLRWGEDPDEAGRELVRQQWNFSPDGSTHEIEDYRFSLEGVGFIELEIRPDLSGEEARATLQQLRLA